MKRLIIGLIVVMCLLVPVSCAAPPPPMPAPAIKTLTGSEQNTMVRVALAHPEVAKWLETADKYTTEVGWVAIGWNDGKTTGWSRLDYEEIADGNLPSDITYPGETVTIQPRVNIRVGEPVRLFIYVAFDREAKEVVDVQLAPGR